MRKNGERRNITVLQLQRRGSEIDRGQIIRYLQEYCPECGRIVRLLQAEERNCSIDQLPPACENGNQERCTKQLFQPTDRLWKGEIRDSSLPNASPGYALFAMTLSNALRFVIQTPVMPGQEGPSPFTPHEYVPLDKISLPTTS